MLLQQKMKWLTWLIPIVLAVISYAYTYYSSFFTGSENFSWEVIIIDSLGLLLLWGVTKLTINKYSQRQPKIGIKLFLGLILGLTALMLLLYVVHKQYLIITTPQYDSIRLLHVIVNVSGGLMTNFVIVSIQYFLYYQEQWNKELVKIANLEKENTKAQLHALQTQVNPHFLFNNLNTLQSFIATENAKAQHFLSELSDLYRYLLNNKDNEIVTLAEEITTAQRFNYLIQQRFGTAYSCQMEVEGVNKETVYLPPFTIQMLLENVVKHNRIEDTHPVKCVIKIDKQMLVVSNNLQAKYATYRSNQIGLNNLRKRYQILSNQSIQVQKTTTHFNVAVPLLTIDEYGV